MKTHFVILKEPKKIHTLKKKLSLSFPREKKKL